MDLSTRNAAWIWWRISTQTLKGLKYVSHLSAIGNGDKIFLTFMFFFSLLKVMLVSLCAGGVGLNLVGGNHLFLIDMHW